MHTEHPCRRVGRPGGARGTHRRDGDDDHFDARFRTGRRRGLVHADGHGGLVHAGRHGDGPRGRTTLLPETRVVRDIGGLAVMPAFGWRPKASAAFHQLPRRCGERSRGFARGRASTPIRTGSARAIAPPPGSPGAATDTDRHSPDSAVRLRERRARFPSVPMAPAGRRRAGGDGAGACPRRLDAGADDPVGAGHDRTRRVCLDVHAGVLRLPAGGYGSPARRAGERPMNPACRLRRQRFRAAALPGLRRLGPGTAAVAPAGSRARRL